MHTYTIKKDGYAIGQAKGVHNAVERIRKHVEIMHRGKAWTTWKPGPVCIVEADGGYSERYTIERQQ